MVFCIRVAIGPIVLWSLLYKSPGSEEDMVYAVSLLLLLLKFEVVLDGVAGVPLSFAL